MNVLAHFVKNSHLPSATCGSIYVGTKLKGVSFRRQHAIGKYIVDFCSIKKKLIIELDGSQHLEQEEYDAERTTFLESKGYHVLRFWNHEVMKDIQGVIRTIEFAWRTNNFYHPLRHYSPFI